MVCTVLGTSLCWHSMLKSNETNHLPHKVELANGSRGVVEDIVLDLRERVDHNHGKTIQLQYPPAAVPFSPRGKVQPMPSPISNRKVKQ
ncbi:hypothetical protein EI94DRAFT_1726552 [Lactarius quietus]|nr:hypothetical protein EI94DRAFT_1726552 [Lactarius quietus]